MNNSVHIALITDSNYILPTMVCLQSMFTNKNENSLYDIYILSDNIKPEHVKNLEKFSKDNFVVKVLQIENKYKDLENKNDYVTNSAFLKFDIPNILNEFEKILYIDTDTVILKDLFDLYNTNIENSIAGVVKDVGDIFYKRSKDLSLINYFNSGVILYNAKKYREKACAKSALKVYLDNGQSFICHDQDTLNLVFNNDVVWLSPFYNYQQSLAEYSIKKVAKFYNISEKEVKNTDDIVILHYTRMKPWVYKSASFKNFWDKYFLLTGFKDHLNLKSGIALKYYFIIRNYFNLKFMRNIIKKLKTFKDKNNKCY